MMQSNAYHMSAEQSVEPSYISDRIESYSTESVLNRLSPIPQKKQTIDYDSLVTEDDTPVDNFYCEIQLRLLPESLKNSWDRKDPYIVAADVGIYDYNPVSPIVPDVFLSLDVQYANDIWAKRNRCYMMDIFNKPPELAIEVVSNKEGGENSTKRNKYAALGIQYYAIFDPMKHILSKKLLVYELHSGAYKPLPTRKRIVWFHGLNLGLTVKYGLYENMKAYWLRWCDAEGNILLSGTEGMLAERKRLRAEKKRAELERKRAEAEKKRADALAQELEKLKAEMANQQKERNLA